MKNLLDLNFKNSANFMKVIFGLNICHFPPDFLVQSGQPFRISPSTGTLKALIFAGTYFRGNKFSRISRILK